MKADTDVTEAHRSEQLKRLDGVATILAKTAARDTSLLALLAEDAVVSDAAKALKREMLEAAGIEPPPRRSPSRSSPSAAPAGTRAPGRARSRSCPRQLANPFLAPDFSAAEQRQRRARAGWPRWELLGPLLQLVRASRRRRVGVHGRCPSPRSLRRRPASS